MLSSEKNQSLALTPVSDAKAGVMWSADCRPLDGGV